MRYDSGQAAQILTRTPAALQALLGGLPQVWTHADEGGDSWSPFGVVGHLIHGELTDWIPRARSILEQDGVFEPFDRFAQEQASVGKSMDELLQQFSALRHESLTILGGWRLTPEALARTGLHPEFGRVTLEQHLATWIAHDLSHLGQIVRVMAKQYREAVGPWKRYLPLLG